MAVETVEADKPKKPPKETTVTTVRDPFALPEPTVKRGPVTNASSYQTAREASEDAREAAMREALGLPPEV